MLDLESQRQMLDLAAKGPQSFLDRLCVAKHVLDRRDPKSRELERTFDHQITTGNASERLAIHDCSAHFAKWDRDFAREHASLEECMKLTEEVIGLRFRMISCLINLKDVEAASAELGKFRLTTRNRGKMVAESQEKLDNLIAESAESRTGFAPPLQCQQHVGGNRHAEEYFGNGLAKLQILHIRFRQYHDFIARLGFRQLEATKRHRFDFAIGMAQQHLCGVGRIRKAAGLLDIILDLVA